jgi:hypothetical protein
MSSRRPGNTKKAGKPAKLSLRRKTLRDLVPGQGTDAVRGGLGKVQLMKICTNQKSGCGPN